MNSLAPVKCESNSTNVSFILFNELISWLRLWNCPYVRVIEYIDINSPCLISGDYALQYNFNFFFYLYHQLPLSRYEQMLLLITIVIPNRLKYLLRRYILSDIIMNIPKWFKFFQLPYQIDCDICSVDIYLLSLSLGLDKPISAAMIYSGFLWLADDLWSHDKAFRQRSQGYLQRATKPSIQHNSGIWSDWIWDKTIKTIKIYWHLVPFLKYELSAESLNLSQ